MMLSTVTCKLLCKIIDNFKKNIDMLVKLKSNKNFKYI